MGLAHLRSKYRSRIKCGSVGTAITRSTGGASRINPGLSTGTSPQGNTAAFAEVGFNRHGFNKSFTEHGVILGYANIRADLTYQQGIEKMWTRQDRLDFFFPALAHLGEQAVLSKEMLECGEGPQELKPPPIYI